MPIVGRILRMQKLGQHHVILLTEEVDSMRFYASFDPDRRNDGMPFSGGRATGFTGAAVSDVGCLRPNNEDNYILENDFNENSSEHSESSVVFAEMAGMWHVAGVFDGLGGGEMGEAASRNAAEVFRQGMDFLKSARSKAEIDDFVRRSFLQANNRIVELQRLSNVFGTTGTVVCANGEVFKIYHLGDSRAYLFRENTLFQITRDQTLAQVWIDAGLHSKNDPCIEAGRHKLTNYIGRDRTGKNLRPVESQWLPQLIGDTILLCTDGLHNSCTDGMITQILKETSSPGEKASQLVHAALTNGGKDNITCISMSFF